MSVMLTYFGSFVTVLMRFAKRSCAFAGPLRKRNRGERPSVARCVAVAMALSSGRNHIETLTATQKRRKQKTRYLSPRRNDHGGALRPNGRPDLVRRQADPRAGREDSCTHTRPALCEYRVRGRTCLSGGDFQEQGALGAAQA